MTFHVPVMADAVVAIVREAPAGPIVDGTLGGGGHAAAILGACDDARPVIGIDQDRQALAAARARLGDRIRLLHGNFGDLEALLDDALGVGSQVAGIVLDLGVSSWQLDTAERGFAFKHRAAAPDMRMDTSDSARETAGQLIDRLTPTELGRLLADLGEVKGAFRLARKLKTRRAEGLLETTGQLADCVNEGSQHHRGRKLAPATQVFQALRIAVNGELVALDRALDAAANRLVDDGRLVVISYHSLEDRRVKQHIARGADGPPRPGHLPPPTSWRPTWRRLTTKAVVAGQQEVARNPRSRSARLRAAARARRTPGLQP